MGQSAASSAWAALVCCSCSWGVLISAVSAAYDPSLIVANIDTDCPIPTVLYPPEQYSTASLITIFAPLPARLPRQECREQATNLAVCALDGSLGVKSGCCSTSCSAAMAQLASLNCFQDILSTLCTVSPEQQMQVQPLIPILATVAERCANYIAPPSVACPDGRVLSTASTAGPAGPVLNAPSAAPNMNSTALNMTVNMTGMPTNMTGDMTGMTTNTTSNITGLAANRTGNMTGLAANRTGMALMPGAAMSPGPTTPTLQSPAVAASPAPPLAP